MKKPYSIKLEDSELLCPDCSSKNIELNDKVSVSNDKGHHLKQYVCKDCKSKFIPAIVGSTSDSKNKINEWSKKIRMTEGLNDGKSWETEKKEYIIIRDVK